MVSAGMTPADVLRKAAELMEAAPFRQGGGRGHCALSAIGKAALVLATEADAEAIRFADACVGQRIEDFNDAPGRTKEEVIAALLAAADKADQVSP
jgi:hypothetical protein